MVEQSVKSDTISTNDSITDNEPTVNSKHKELSAIFYTVVLAAPITVKGVPYYKGVIVLRDSKTQRLYVHEIITEKRTDMLFKTGADKIGSSGNIPSPSIISLLAKIQNVKKYQGTLL